jgi:hypothetical protein
MLFKFYGIVCPLFRVNSILEFLFAEISKLSIQLNRLLVHF